MIKPGSQNARLLEVLGRGPATNADIHREAGHMVVNSRVSELVKKHGYRIVCEHLGGSGAGAYRYTLLQEPPLEQPDPVSSDPGSGSSSGDSSGKGAASHAKEEGPRSPTPAAGGPDAQEPTLGAPSSAPQSPTLSPARSPGGSSEHAGTAVASNTSEVPELRAGVGDRQLSLLEVAA